MKLTDKNKQTRLKQILSALNVTLPKDENEFIDSVTFFDNKVVVGEDLETELPKLISPRELEETLVSRGVVPQDFYDESPKHRKFPKVCGCFTPTTVYSAEDFSPSPYLGNFNCKNCKGAGILLSDRPATLMETITFYCHDPKEMLQFEQNNLINKLNKQAPFIYLIQKNKKELSWEQTFVEFEPPLGCSVHMPLIPNIGSYSLRSGIEELLRKKLNFLSEQGRTFVTAPNTQQNPRQNFPTGIVMYGMPPFDFFVTPTNNGK